MPPTARRHVVVLGAQCAAMEHLDRLEESATLLHSVLADPSLGGCAPGLRDGRSLVLGAELTGARIGELLREAYRFAGERGAVLVVALLGHGFTPGGTSSLYYMGTDSRPEVRDAAVEVGPLLRDAADQDGVQGVVCVTDTCHAGAAMPSSRDLAAGVRGGSTRLAVLMSCGAAQPARDLGLSRELTALLQQGESQGGRFIGVGTAARALRGRVVGQNVGYAVWDGHPFAQEPMWLVRNARHPAFSVPPRTGVLGPRSREELATALAALDPPLTRSQLPTGLEEASGLLALLADRPADHLTQRAVRAVDGLVVSLRTVNLLSEWLGSAVTTAHLYRALGAVLTAEAEVPRSRPRPTLPDVVDHVVHEHPVTDPDCRRWLTHFVVMLGLEADQNPEDPVVQQWARSIDASVQLNDALLFARARRENRQLTLVVSLHASLTGDWPDSLDAWLLREGTVVGHEQFPAAAADRASAEDALDDAVIWADGEAEELGISLRRVDVALPTALLLSWRPEESGLGVRLGHQYEVVLHWSGRLAPTRLQRKLRRTVEDRWERMLACNADVPLDWLDRHAVQNRERLYDELHKGRYSRGIVLLHHPGDDEPLVELLLSYTPVFLWPQRDGDRAAWRDGLDRYWPTMPAGLTHAYRRSWLGDRREAVADLRAVWDSGEWLAFCRSVAHPVLPSASRPLKEEK
ncbi:hypothetical protein AB0D34_17345 [Streptomyces sp. NPDC048420]|uniref:vWA-MoxR associated conflict system protein n=1 Tax=Streptomyces sp. NPDC048420 TaxID=3155755 RepID=UPI00342C7457